MSTLLDKALAMLNTSRVEKASRGTLSDFILNAPHAYGQPLPQVAEVDAQGLITMERMREIVMKVGTPAACLNATLDYATNVNIAIRNVDPSQKADPDIVAFVEKFLRRPNRNDSGLEFRQKVLRDLWTFGMAAIEIERGPNGHLANLNVLDMARLRIDYDEHGTVLGYNMLDIRGMPIRMNPTSDYAWSPDEVILIKLNPVSSSLYGTSRVSQLFTYAVIEDLMHHFIGQRFTDSNVPHGVMDLGDITEDELRRAINNWNAQADSPHKIMLTGSKGSSKWYPFGYHLKDLEAPALIAAIQAKIMAIVGVTKNELGDAQDVSKSNGYNLSYTFKKRAIEPLLNAFIEKLTTRLLWDVLGLEDLEFYYHEIDSRDELVAAQIDDTYMKLGVLTLNQIRNRRGDPSVEGGDEPMMYSGSSWIPVKYLDMYAQAELMAILAVDQGTEEGGQSGPGMIQPPSTHVLQPGNRVRSPLGGSTLTPRIRITPPRQANREIGQSPRGNIQTMRSVGARNDEMK